MEKKQILVLTSLFLFLVAMSSCNAIAGIFKAGMWTMLIIIILVVALVIYLIGRSKK